MADRRTEPDIPVNKRNPSDPVVCVLVDPFEVGDCQMNGGAQLEVRVPNNAGISVVTWEADVFSRHPQFAFHDTWHQTFHLKTELGTVVATVGPFDSPDLDNANQVKHVKVERNASVDPALFGGITKVDWEAEC
jgi:hypothetical protein